MQGLAEYILLLDLLELNSGVLQNLSQNYRQVILKLIHLGLVEFTIRQLFFHSPAGTGNHRFEPPTVLPST
jgi:hypothetical protein